MRAEQGCARRGRCQSAWTTAIAWLVLVATFAAQGSAQANPPAQHPVPPPRKGAVSLGHNGAVLTAAFSPDGKLLLTGSEDRTAVLWDLRQGLPRITFQGHQGAVVAVAFGPQGCRALTGSADATVLLWDIKRGKPLLKFRKHRAPISSLALSPDGRQVLSASEDGKIILWETRTGQTLHTLQHKPKIVFVSFTPRGPRALASLAPDNLLDLVDVRTGQVIRTFWAQGEKAITCAALSANGRWILAGGTSGKLFLWNAQTGRLAHKLQIGHGGVCSAAFSPRGRWVLVGTLYGPAVLLETQSGKRLATFRKHRGPVCSVAFAPRGLLMFLGCRDLRSSVWDIHTGKLVHILERPLVKLDIHSVRFSSGGKKVFMRIRDGTAVCWNAQDGKLLQNFPFPTDHEHATVGAFSPQARWVMTKFVNKIAVWETSTGKKVFSFQHPEKKSVCTRAVFSPDDRQLAAHFLINGQKVEIFCWEFLQRKRLHRWVFDTSELSRTAMTFGPNGLWFELAERVVLLDVSSGKRLRALQPTFGGALALIPTRRGDRLLVGNYKGAQLWDTKSGKLLRTFGQNVRAVAMSSEGSKVLTASHDSAQLWDAQTGKVLRRFAGHLGGIKTLALSPDGTLVLTVGEDGAWLWEANTGRRLLRWFPLPGKNWIAMTEQGYFIGSPNAMPRISHRDLHTGELIPWEQSLQYYQPTLVAKALE